MRRKRRMAPYRVEMKIWREQSGIKSWRMFPLRARESKLGDTSWSVPCAGRGWWRPSTSARWLYNYIWQSPPVCRVSGWSRGLQHLLPAANCETKLCQLFLESVFISAPQECPQCLEPLTGRNILVENISAILFSQNYAGHDKEKLEKEKFQISTHLLFAIYLLAKFLVRLAGSLNLLSETEIKSSWGHDSELYYFYYFWHRDKCVYLIFRHCHRIFKT